MSKKANPTVIGVFVVAALAIAVAAIVTLGSGKLFKQTETFVMYFESSLSGLDVGAPVELQGVRVGEVSAIKLVYDTESGSSIIPVYVEIDGSRWERSADPTSNEDISVHIERGLRAQLQSQSMVTGKLKIMLVVVPDAPVRLVGGDPTVDEIPTILNITDALINTLDSLPLADIVSNVNTTLEEIADVMGSRETKDALEALRKTMANTEEISASVRDLLDESAPFRVELETAAAELTEAVKALRLLTEQIDRHPESLIWGK
jgi:paraquat-inducible protein B